MKNELLNYTITLGDIAVILSTLLWCAIITYIIFVAIVELVCFLKRKIKKERGNKS